MSRLPWDMTGKVVVVTGGNAGIGLGFARGIARAGGDVVIWGRRREKNDEAAKALTRVRRPGASPRRSTCRDEARVVAAMDEVVRGDGPRRRCHRQRRPDDARSVASSR